MMSPEDTGIPCVDCNQGTYVLYEHGPHCRYCGQPQEKPVKTVQPTRAKVKRNG